jgi:hypothetical protein
VKGVFEVRLFTKGVQDASDEFLILFVELGVLADQRHNVLVDVQLVQTGQEDRTGPLDEPVMVNVVYPAYIPNSPLGNTPAASLDVGNGSVR